MEKTWFRLAEVGGTLSMDERMVMIAKRDVLFKTLSLMRE
jgi:hypothetical protein